MLRLPAAALSVPTPRHCTGVLPSGRPSRPVHLCRANYRWSADESGGGKRESLYNEQAGPRSSNGNGSGAAATDGWPEEWQQWLDADSAGGQPDQAQADGADGVGTVSNGRRPRRRPRAAAASSAGQQPPPGARQAPADGAGPAGPADDASVQAELRQLRGRQAARAGRRQREGEGALADPWAQEWGPLEGAPAAAAAAQEDFGWAAESWAANGNANAQPQRGREQGPAAGAGPGSSWELAQQQRELRRRRRRAAAGGGGPLDDDAGLSGAAARPAYSPPAAGDGTAPGGQQQQHFGSRYGAASQQPGRYGGEEQELYEQDGSTGWAGEYEEQYSEAYEPGEMVEPDIALLSTEELDRVLPVVPFSQQAAFFSGSATDSVQRWGASLAATVVLSKVAVLAASSLTWPLWWPWALAAKKNLSLRRQYSYGGLWRTQVLGVTITGRPRPFAALDGGERGGTVRVARVLVGDPGGARTEMVLPYDSRYELIQGGEAAELVVLSGDTSFQRFKAVKDVYLPASGLWVSEYPHADRSQLLEVSLAVEREAQEAAVAASQPGSDSSLGGQFEEGQYGAGWQQDGYGGRPQY